MFEEYRGMKCRNNSSEKYACKGEERNGSSWRGMCELDLIFTLIIKSINRNGERDDSGKSDQREKEVIAMAK